MDETEDVQSIWDMKVREAFLLLCMLVGASFIGYKIGEFIGDRIADVATGRSLQAG